MSGNANVMLKNKKTGNVADDKAKAELQVALDFVDLDRAMKVARACYPLGVRWLEAGTPLIKAEGLECVRCLRREFPDAVIVADMKTADTGAVEVEAAVKAGASVAVILALADDATVIEGVKEANRYGAKIMVDMLGVPAGDMVSRACALEKMGVHYIGYHLTIDEQMKGMVVGDDFASLRKAVSIPISVAGGLDEGSVGGVVSMGADVVIVGSAITKQTDVAAAAKRVLSAMKGVKYDMSRRAHSGIDIKYILSGVSTPNISDAMHGEGAMKGILPQTQGKKIIGRARTVRAFNGDWSKPVEMIDSCEQGDIIVIDAAGGDIALWGELATHSALNKGVEGVVIDGAIRDIDEIRRLDFGAFARFVCPNAGEARGVGETGVRVLCGGLYVDDGDYIVGDDNGVVVIPKADAVEIANRARSVFENENRVRAEITAGSTLSLVQKLGKWERVR